MIKFELQKHDKQLFLNVYKSQLQQEYSNNWYIINLKEQLIQEPQYYSTRFYTLSAGLSIHFVDFEKNDYFNKLFYLKKC